MTTQEGKRKLVAILSADVKGYSRLMGEDEEISLLSKDFGPIKGSQVFDLRDITAEKILKSLNLKTIEPRELGATS